MICGFWRTGVVLGQPDLRHRARHRGVREGTVLVLFTDQRGDGERRGVSGAGQGEPRIGTFGHGFTYSGHPVPAAVAIETLKLYDEMEIGAHVGSVGPYLQKELRRRFADHPLVGEVRGLRSDRGGRTGGRQGRPTKLRSESQGGRPHDQDMRGKRRDRPRGVERLAVP